jgi:AmiR/NasT family two-component response regulator
LESTRRLLEHEGITVVGVAANSAEALQRAEELRPDVTLVARTSATRAAWSSPGDSTAKPPWRRHR